MFTVLTASSPYNTTQFASANFYISTKCAVTLLCIDLFKPGNRFTGGIDVSLVAVVLKTHSHASPRRS